MLVRSLLDVLSSSRSALTFVAFMHFHKAIDIAWVKATLVRLDEGDKADVPFRDTQSQV